MLLCNLEAECRPEVTQRPAQRHRREADLLKRRCAGPEHRPPQAEEICIVALYFLTVFPWTGQSGSSKLKPFISKRRMLISSFKGLGGLDEAVSDQ